MHYLHPRSRTTGTLFTTTLAISFAVVALPHILPCPVDRRQFADSYETPDGKVMRRKRKKPVEEGVGGDGLVELVNDAPVATEARPKRECPVPKPMGLVGQLMGFKYEERPVPTEVIVQTVDKKRSRQISKQAEDIP